MPGKVFISCGQGNSKERKVARDILVWLRKKGFDPYVAIDSQSIEDINSEIISKLKQSDYYIFIDFKREPIANSNCRGSLFTNQELAIAYSLGFKKTIFLKHKDVKSEGVGKYILSNARTFNAFNDVVALVKNEVNKRKWSPRYSRQLVVKDVVLYPLIPYKDHSLQSPQNRRICHAHIKNCRNDSVAVNVIAHLIFIVDENTNRRITNADRSDLKWALQGSYTRNIAPKDIAPLDIFGIDDQNHFYLHSLSDTYPRKPIIDKNGKYLLVYQLYYSNFPITNFGVRVNLSKKKLTINLIV